MTLFSRAFRALAPALLFAPLPLQAQDAPTPAPQFAQPNDPWIFRGTDITVDPEWLFGEMPNGVRYAVRHNGVPPGQVSLRIRIDAGSLHERKGEEGFAHLLEHMTYRESKYLGFGEAIPKFQRWGAEFGSDTNAETTPTHTVYKLALPNAQPATLEEAIKLMAFMVREPTLSKEDLAADLPIVLAERRDRVGPEIRVADATRETLFSDTLLADHGVIGTVEALQGATPAAVRAFHDRWYRPENTVVVAAGDVDQQVLASLIEKYFGDWKVAGKHTPAPDFGAPKIPAGADPANPVGATRVVVEPGQPRSFTYVYARPYVQVTDNLELNRLRLLDTIGQLIITRRLEKRAREGGHYLFAQADNADISRSISGTFVTFAPLDANWRAALADVRGVIADALATPPSQAEIDRERAQLEVAFVNQVEQRSVQAGSALADDVVNAVDIGEAVGTPDLFLRIFREMEDRFTPEAVLEHTRALYKGNAIRALYLTPAIGEASAEDVAAALRLPAVASADGRLNTAALSFADLPPIGLAAAPVQKTRIGVYDIEQYDWANGVKALVWNSRNEPGRVTVRVRFGSGWRGFDGKDGVYAKLGEYALIPAGEGELGQDEIEAVTSGRKLGFTFKIDKGAFTFEGLTRKEDLADQLYLFALKLAQPKWDSSPVERALASMKLAYDSYDANATAVLNRDFEYLLSNRDPRFATADPAALDAMSVEGFRRTWEPLLRQGPIEIDVFGDIDTAAAVEAIGKTFGALPPREPIPASALARKVTFPAGQPPVTVYHGGDADQAAAVIAWEGGSGSAKLVESRKVDLMTKVYSNRLLDALREEAGDAYSPQVFSDWPTDVDNGGRIIALANIPAARVPEFFTMAEKIAADMAATPATAEELSRATEPMAQLINRLQTGHTFWLNQLEGSTADVNLVNNLRSLLLDYTQTSPEELRALAAKYLVPGRSFRISVLPRAGNETASAGSARAVGGR